MKKFHSTVAQYPVEAPDVVLKDDDSCSLYFTSGTTGTPKPILLTHNNLKCAAITENAHHHQIRADNFILIPPFITPGLKCIGSAV